MGKTRIIDLSVVIENNSPAEPWPPKINYSPDHRQGADELREKFGISAEALAGSAGLGWAFEDVAMITHAGTHLDAPWHYHPISEGKIAKTIDEVPLEWCYGDGVVLDLRHKKPTELISVDDLKKALAKISYTIKPFDIVMIWTDADKRIGTPAYFDQPGMGREGTLWLVEQGVKIIGVDMYGFDRKFQDMADEYKRTGDGKVFWQAHFAGITREYCHIEKLANLDKIPQPTGFKVACFPIKLRKATAGWIRAVAIISEG